MTSLMHGSCEKKYEINSNENQLLSRETERSEKFTKESHWLIGKRIGTDIYSLFMKKIVCGLYHQEENVVFSQHLVGINTLFRYR